jgi:hypothetical protein
MFKQEKLANLTGAGKKGGLRVALLPKQSGFRKLAGTIPILE